MEIDYFKTTLDRLLQLELKQIAASDRSPRAKLAADLNAKAKFNSIIRLADEAQVA